VSKSLKWNYPYTIRGGDTLSAIANNITNAARAAGAPSNTVVTYQQIYNYNKAVIDSTANAHGNPIPGGAANNIFPGEKIWLPTWS
jgi:nucleoid-associated protein YgaU